MGILRATSDLRILGRSLLLSGALALGCESAPQKQALPATIAPSMAATSLLPTTTANDGLDEFKQGLVRKLDRARWRTRPASPQGGILHMPDGQAVHAAILVKNPDGTVRRECVSSAAEVSALVEEIRRGRAQ
jgi:hypothetical protein